VLLTPRFGVGLKLNKLFKEVHHEHRGKTDRIDYVFTRKVTSAGNKSIPSGSLYFSIRKSHEEGGWTFLGRHFNSVQGAKKEARKYCNDKASNFT
jgi:hypothetical protein